jgi:hypothetical protein
MDLDQNLAINDSCVAVITGMCYHAQLLLIKVGSLPNLASNFDPLKYLAIQA